VREASTSVQETDLPSGRHPFRLPHRLDDALYAVGAGISLSVSARTQIKLEWLDTYKNRPPVPGIQKNDMP
jgi:hypothetical protein